jgi:hypothetical protein
VVVTKPTGWIALAPILLLWGLAQLRQRAVTRTVLGSIAVVALIGVLAGPYLYRVTAEFGSPLGPPDQSAGLTLQRHDPPSVLVNALRIGSSTLLVPVETVDRAASDAVIRFAHAIGVDPQDPATTIARSAYPSLRWSPDEDRSPYPVQSALVLLATFGVLLTRGVPGRIRAYALTVLGAMIAYAAVLKWQPWGNRLVASVLIIGAPLVGWALSALATRPPQLRDRLRPVFMVAVAAVVIGLSHGYYAVARGAPRPLVGAQSVLIRDEWDVRFARQPQILPYYRWGAAVVRASGAHRVGIVLRGDEWEYPWWVLMPGVELISLESVLPHHPPPPASSLDAILCVAPAKECQAYVPAGWRFDVRGGWFGVATKVSR